MEYFGSTDQGARRSSNQDAFRIKIAGNLLVATVCDGMGGANGGNIASAIGVESYTKKLSKYINSALSFVFLGDIPEFGVPCENFPDLRLGDFITKSVEVANAEVFGAAEKDSSLSGMGTTLTSCIVTPTGIVTANIGDSRIYHVCDGTIRQLTKDHSLVQSLVDEGKVRRFVCGNNRRFFYQALKDEKCGHHIHLKCLSCGKMVHLSGFVSDFIEKNILAANRFTIDGQMTLLYGKCENCQEKR